MKCMSCPLLATDGGIDDVDCICLADTDFQFFPDIDGFDIEVHGCSRSNKWIREQAPKKLMAAYWENEAGRWKEYAETGMKGVEQ